MGYFLNSEKPKQAKFKADSPYFSDAARAEGVYKGKSRPFCLPIDRAEENLFPEIRKTAPAFFAAQSIKWHDGQNGKPSNHLCDSQVCCINFLYPFANQPNELAKVLRPIFPTLKEMLTIEKEQYVTFEWIGEGDYLGEKINARNKKRSRGALCTSADAAVKFKHVDGKVQIVLIEWKYTESYGGQSLKISQSGKDRTEIYQPLFQKNDCPVNKNLLPDFDSLFFEPFYQLMRQQFLAHEMESRGELGANIVSVLHIAPERNNDFRKVTSPGLEKLGETATGVWMKLMQSQDRFMSVSTEQLFGKLSVEQLPEMQAWLEYITMRYAWVQSTTTTLSK